MQGATPDEPEASEASGGGRGPPSDCLLFRVLVSNPLQCGADLSHLSYFASEAEYLYPPLTFLRPTRRLTRLTFQGTAYTVIDVEPIFPS
jgi:hypothetical protein